MRKRKAGGKQPRLRQGFGGQAAASGKKQEAANKARKKILLVDDEVELVKMTSLVLESSGFEVIPAYSGNEALEKVFSASPDIVLLDIMMPGISGLEVLRKIRSNPKTRGIPVIMITGREDMNALFEAQDLKSTNYVLKPVESKELIAVISRYI